ncbi:MAG: hypothetical protein Q7S96_00890 [bacterium]|nr:hypothetical protein [bacterium]
MNASSETSVSHVNDFHRAINILRRAIRGQERDAIARAKVVSPVVVRFVRTLFRVYLIQWGVDPMSGNELRAFIDMFVVSGRDRAVLTPRRTSRLYRPLLHSALLVKHPVHRGDTEIAYLVRPNWNHPLRSSFLDGIARSHIGRHRTRTEWVIRDPSLTVRSAERVTDDEEVSAQPATYALRNGEHGPVYLVHGVSSMREAIHAVLRYRRKLPKQKQRSVVIGDLHVVPTPRPDVRTITVET